MNTHKTIGQYIPSMAELEEMAEANREDGRLIRQMMKTRERLDARARATSPASAAAPPAEPPAAAKLEEMPPRETVEPTKKAKH